MSTSARLTEALALLNQSPPGQTSQVYHDLRGILFDAESNAADKLDDAQLQSAAAVALEEYNTQQLVTATLPSSDAKDVPVIICQAGQLPDSNSSNSAPGVKRYTHPKLKKTFLYDHVKRTASDVQDVQVAEGDEVEKTRLALEKAMDEYVKDRYPDGVSSVFAVLSVPIKEQTELAEDVEKAQAEGAKTPAENTASVTEGAADDEGEAASAAKAASDETQQGAKDDDDPVETAAAIEETSSTTTPASTTTTPPSAQPTYALHHVGNRFNLSNFWSGRWRASYTLDPTTLVLTSSVSVQVHYFENGNVQLHATRPRTFQLAENASRTPDELAKQIAKLIASHEDAWQSALEQTYDELAERAFKALRRQLPLTRQKIDWDKVLNYKLGDELSRA